MRTWLWGLRRASSSPWGVKPRRRLFWEVFENGLPKVAFNNTEEVFDATSSREYRFVVFLVPPSICCR